MQFTISRTISLVAVLSMAATSLAAPVEGNALQAREPAEEASAPAALLVRGAGEEVERRAEGSSSSSPHHLMARESKQVTLPAVGKVSNSRVLTVSADFLHDSSGKFAVKLSNSGAAAKWTVSNGGGGSTGGTVAANAIETVFLDSIGRLSAGGTVTFDVTKG